MAVHAHAAGGEHRTIPAAHLARAEVTVWECRHAGEVAGFFELEQRDDVDEIVAKSKAVAAQQQPRPMARALVSPVPPREEHVAELDRVLDKISLEGLESLTPAERAVLDEMARRLRGEDGQP